LLFLWPGTSTLIRGQGTYVGDDEINKIVEFVGTNEPEFVKELVQLKPAAPAEAEASAPRHRDDMYDAAVDVVIREGRGSVSLLQRSLGIGYGRAARLIDFMAEDGVVGTYNGSQAREVLITIEQWHAMNGDAVEKPEPPKARRNKVMPDPSEEDQPAPIPSGRARHSVILNVEHSDADDEEDDEADGGDEVTDEYEDEASSENQLDDEAADDEQAEDEEAEVQPTKSRAAGRVTKPLAPKAEFDEESSDDDFEETDEAESEEDDHDPADSDDDADSPPVRRFKAESA
jgi:S-DNA-T family DNA segregation ATPase FtsK/SpoIIIE